MCEFYKFCSDIFQTAEILSTHAKVEHVELRASCNCPVENCYRSFNNFYSYRMHLIKTHKELSHHASSLILSENNDNSRSLSRECTENVLPLNSDQSSDDCSPTNDKISSNDFAIVYC
ncbi:hypothetical protein PV327_011355 [Microctonus hyperodae]|uniref:C2H2-type domain-containing protein n=1 Tax=Microctonus hyperodae TaxID=165561 RepID=A0AA39FKR6_MICHY|nr:hypothetical protein PV327_011355 [Microctonus hyperodae]